MYTNICLDNTGLQKQGYLANHIYNNKNDKKFIQLSYHWIQDVDFFFFKIIYIKWILSDRQT